MLPFNKKSDISNFSDPAARNAFVQATPDARTLLQNELVVNRSEQLLLRERIRLMTDFVNDLPASDPQYSMLLIGIQMDLVEIDELKAREFLIQQQLGDTR